MFLLIKATFLCSLVHFRKGQAPSFVDKPAIRQGTNSVIFEVRCKAAPEPTVTWYMGTTVIKHGGRYNITVRQEAEIWYLLCEITVSRRLFWGMVGALTGGSWFYMSILRKPTVALSNLRNAHVALSNLRNLHVPCHYHFNSHVACH